jgi:hypothetical protein
VSNFRIVSTSACPTLSGEIMYFAAVVIPGTYSKEVIQP